MEPIRLSTKTEAQINWTPIFYVDDKAYEMASPVPAYMTVSFLADLRRMEYPEAIARHMDRVAPGAIDALASIKGLSTEQLGQVLRQIREAATSSAAFVSSSDGGQGN